MRNSELYLKEIKRSTNKKNIIFKIRNLTHLLKITSLFQILIERYDLGV